MRGSKSGNEQIDISILWTIQQDLKKGKREWTFMNENQRKMKEPISKDKIFKVMLYVTYIVAALFLLKNIFGKSLVGAAVIGASLAVFTVILLVMRSGHAEMERQQFVVSMSLVFLVFIISLNSGASYSDDFPLYLAVIGLTGMYLRPKYTLIQGVLADILLILQYVINPEKAESAGQFFLCLGVFILASVMFYLAIQRGRAFILMSQARAEEAEELLKSLLTVGEELQHNYENSSRRIGNLQEANTRLEGNASDLKQSSDSITRGAREVEYTCDNVQDRIQVTEGQIDTLNGEVKTFETALVANRRNMQEMNRQMETVKRTMHETNEVFHMMEQRMQEIHEVTEQLNSISGSTTMLALNASIEAARAGQAGVGFAVVASKVQELAVDSNKCSAQVADVVNAMQEQIQTTTRQLGESAEAINASLGALEGLQSGFDELTQQFGSLYGNIEEQNSNISQVESIFGELKDKIADMSAHSEENQAFVAAISEAMGIYQESMNQVIDDTRHVHELSASMLAFSGDKRA